MSKKKDSASIPATLPAPIVESYGTSLNGKHWVLLKLTASTTTDPRKSYLVIREERRIMAMKRNAAGNWRPRLQTERRQTVTSFNARNPKPDGTLFLDEDVPKGRFRYRVRIVYEPIGGNTSETERSAASDDVKLPLD